MSASSRFEGSAILTIFILVSLLAVVMLYNSSTSHLTPTGPSGQVKGAATTAPISQTTLAPSSAGAKAFISQAYDAANKGNYREAVTIIEQAIQAYPDDQQLVADHDQLESEALQNGQ